MGVLGKELIAKKLKEEFLLLKTDMLMEPRISLFLEQVNARGMAGNNLTIDKRNAAMCSICAISFLLLIEVGQSSIA